MPDRHYQQQSFSMALSQRIKPTDVLLPDSANPENNRGKQEETEACYVFTSF